MSTCTGYAGVVSAFHKVARHFGTVRFSSLAPCTRLRMVGVYSKPNTTPYDLIRDLYGTFDVEKRSDGTTAARVSPEYHIEFYDKTYTKTKTRR